MVESGVHAKLDRISTVVMTPSPTGPISLSTHRSGTYRDERSSHRLAYCRFRMRGTGPQLAFTLRPPRCTAVDRNPTGVMSLSRPEANRRLPRQIIDLAATATGRGFGVLSLSNVSAQLQRTPEHGRFPPARHLHQETHRKLWGGPRIPAKSTTMTAQNGMTYLAAVATSVEISSRSASATIRCPRGFK